MSGLPSGYTKLEYIQSSGTQYINTAFKPKSTSRVVMDFEFIENAVASPFMSRDISNDTNMFGVFNINGRLRSDFNTTKVSFSAGLSPLQKLLYDRNKNVCTIGSETITNANGTFSAPRPLFLFASNDSGSAAYFSTGKLYSCAIYDNGTLVRDFVPCKNASGAVGLYDLVGKQFYANAGTGTFTAGPEIPAPEAPTALQTVLAVVLQWAASANADRYDVYRDDAKLGSTETTQYVDTTAEPNETYVYTVKAVNGGGDSAGTSITVYTKSGYFEYKPLIESANFP